MERDNQKHHPPAAHAAHSPHADGVEFATFATREDFSRIQKRKGACLPHWTAEGAVYHVTFRLHDSLPESARISLMHERERILAEIGRPNCPMTRYEKDQLLFLHSLRIDRCLDAGHGSCWLKNESIAGMVANALRFFDGDRYSLFAWCVMPNHVHAVVQPADGRELAAILHSWKSYTANQANRMLGRSGKFWQQEYFDRVLRDETEFLGAIEYVFANPDRAGLPDWKWRWRREIGG
jgi:REP element-mobilizing transposase RayT